MLSKWPIGRKVFFVAGLLAVVVGTLAWNAIHGLYAYRGMVRVLNRRVPELPLANDFGSAVSDLRTRWYEDLARLRASPAARPPTFDVETLRCETADLLAAAREAFRKYQHALDAGRESETRLALGDNRQETETTHALAMTLKEIARLQNDVRWPTDRQAVERLTAEFDRLQKLASRLPTFLHRNMEESMEAARTQYRTLIVLGWVTTTTTVIGTPWLGCLFYQWIFRPLRRLIAGSRRLAHGEVDYRIKLRTHDEMSELAENMNVMTARFLEIRDDLDRQVAERTQQVVRGEQLASVGFLAAGVAHEINNPLASIAVCAESLLSRSAEPVDEADGDAKLFRSYLAIIEKEAFRCKEITEKLLDFSRIGDSQRQAAELRELVQDVVDMVRHVGKYHNKRIEVVDGAPLFAVVNGREIKQVVLNLITNALDSLDEGGRLRIETHSRQGEAEIIFTDDGCGMTDEVLSHLFEPFFTRRRNGQGTGLGLSISYRIIADHHGTISADSDGPGRGSRFRVRLPAVNAAKEPSHRYQAA